MNELAKIELSEMMEGTSLRHYIFDRRLKGTEYYWINAFGKIMEILSIFSPLILLPIGLFKGNLFFIFLGLFPIFYFPKTKTKYIANIVKDGKLIVCAFEENHSKMAIKKAESFEGELKSIWIADKKWKAIKEIYNKELIEKEPDEMEENT